MIYLDNAATSFPKPPLVFEKLQESMEKYGGCPGRGSYEMARLTSAMVDETRRALAELLHVPEPERVVFTLNATDALNLAIKGVLRSGDHVVTTVMEHNSVTRPLNGLERDGTIGITRVPASPEGVVDPDDIRRALTDRTRLVAMLHGSNVTGTLQSIADVGRIVRAADRLFLVDAAQTAGACPIDAEAMQIDLLAFPGHKGLLGPPGTGGLYVGPRAQVRPLREGGTGGLSELPYQPEQFPMRLEAGSLNTWGIALLRESVRFILHYGVDWIRKHELALTERLLNGLRANERVILYGPQALAQRVAVVSCNVQGWSPAAVGEVLQRAYQIAVRTGLQCAPGAHRTIGTFSDGTVRVSPGYFTTETEIDCAIEALEEIAGRPVPVEVSPYEPSGRTA